MVGVGRFGAVRGRWGSEFRGHFPTRRRSEHLLDASRLRSRGRSRREVVRDGDAFERRVPNGRRDQLPGRAPLDRDRRVQAAHRVRLGGLACARTLPLTDRDLCGLQGMELQGVTFSNSRSYGTHPASASTREGRHVSCGRPPENNDRICEVNAYQARAEFKRRHSAMTFGGLDDLVKQANLLWTRVYSDCMSGTTGQGGAAAGQER